MQTIRLGAIAFVALPGEFFVEWGLQLKSKSPAAFTIPVGLANDAIGYVPVPGVLEQGGYEGMTWRYNQLALTAGEQILNCALKQLYVLFDE